MGKCITITVKKREIPTTPVIVDIKSDKQTYYIGDIAYIKITFKGEGGNKEIWKKLCLYIDEYKVADKDVLVYPNKTQSTTFAIKLEREGVRRICAGWC